MKNRKRISSRKRAISLNGYRNKFGKYLGKMDIVSSLATLSYDKRRSKFFTEELLILLRLVDKNIIDKIFIWIMGRSIWNFQFMPRTIEYAIDGNANKTIELKKIEDSFASAANYLKKLDGIKISLVFIKLSSKTMCQKNILTLLHEKLKIENNLIF